MEEMIISENKRAITLTLNRPDKANAISINMLYQLKKILSEIQDRDDITLIVIKGTGEKVFSAGVDSQEILPLPPEKKMGVYDVMVDIAKLSLTSNKLMITALNGLALGMGTAFCLASDFRLAINNPEIYMQMLEIDVGMFPLFVMSLSYYNFPPAIAAKLIFNVEKIYLPEMQKYGFIHSTYEPDQFEKGLKKFIRSVSRKDPRIILTSKTCLNLERRNILKEVEMEKDFSDIFYGNDEKEINLKEVLDKWK